MKLLVFCHQCMMEIPSSPPTAWVEYRDRGRYEITCRKGHKSIVILEVQQFEILFEIGAYAIIEGFYREAVSSFTSSLERFYEFFIRAVLLNQGIDEDKLDAAWKLITKQSERQLGAFITLYTLRFGVPPKVMDPKKVEFRNDVIHKGKIASRLEAVDYGQHVLDVLRPILWELQNTCPDGIKKTYLTTLNNANQVTKTNAQLPSQEFPPF